MPPLGFATENCLFFGEWLSSKSIFQSLGGCFLDVGLKLQQIIKIVFLSVQRNIFRRKKFPEKNKQFHKLSDIERCFFKKKLVKEKNFWQKTISAVFKTGIYASRGTFWGKICFPKKINCFCTLIGILVSFVALVWDVYQKRFTVYRWRFWEKSFFRTKIFSRNFFQNLRGKLSYFGNESFIDYQKCVSLV